MRRTLIGAASLALGLAGACQAGSAQTATDRSGDTGPAHHVAVDANTYPWSSIGKLFNSVGGSCTGAVISRNEVLTAAHCVYAFRTHRFLPADAIHFLLGYDRGDYRTHARVARYRIGPGYDPVSERATAAADWAVLVLTEPLPDEARPLHPAAQAPRPRTKIMVGGFARDRAYVMTADEDCEMLGTVNGSLISHDCVIAPGDSGAPLLERTETGEVQFFGVAVGIWHVGDRQIGIAAPTSAAALVHTGFVGD